MRWLLWNVDWSLGNNRIHCSSGASLQATGLAHEMHGRRQLPQSGLVHGRCDRLRNKAVNTRNAAVETRIENGQRPPVWARLNVPEVPCSASSTTSISSKASGPRAAPMSTRIGQGALRRGRTGNARAIGSPTRAHPRMEKRAYAAKMSNAARSNASWDGPVWTLSEAAPKRHALNSRKTSSGSEENK